MAGKAKDDAKGLQNYVEKLKTDTIEKDTRLDHLQKRNDRLSTLLKKAMGDIVAEFKASKPFTDLLDTNYTVGFEDFRMEAMENFLEVDFSSIKLNLVGAATSSLLQTSLEDINIEVDAPPSQLRAIPALMPLLHKDDILYLSFVFFLFFFIWSFVFDHLM